MANDDIDQVRDSDMRLDAVASKVHRTASKKTWFFERGRPGDPDYMIFPAGEIEAWNIMYNKSEWMRHDFRMLGVSDGTTYARIISESMAEAARLKPEIDKKRTELERYTLAKETLIMNEAIDMEDLEDEVNAANIEKVKRFDRIIERVTNELETMEKEFRTKTSDVVKTATAAELEVARGHFERPGKINIITPEAQGAAREKILGQLPG